MLSQKQPSKLHKSKISKSTSQKQPALQTKRLIKTNTKSPHTSLTTHHLKSSSKLNPTKSNQQQSHFSTTTTTTTTTPITPNTTFKSRSVSKIVANKALREGNGAIVYRSIGYQPSYFSPFALLDDFNLVENSLSRGLGFGPHPHRGISTLTYILPNEGNGGVQHQDHKGNKGIIGPGDIQFMSAGKGIVHSEMPADNKAVNGLQLWINLRQEDKMSEPEYQEYTSEQLPSIEKDGIYAKIIMGTALGVEAKVKTKTPVHYIHYKLQPNTILHHPLPPHWNTFIYTLNGEGSVNPCVDDNNNLNITNNVNTKQIGPKHTIFFNQGENATESLAQAQNNPHLRIDDGEGISIGATNNPNGFEFILISGEPLTDGAKVVHRGPMILTSREEVFQAFEDFEQSKNGFEGAQDFIQKWKY